MSLRSEGKRLSEVRSIVAATRNAAKVGQLRRLVAGLVEVVPLPPGVELGGGENGEAGSSFEEVAGGKAAGWSRALGTDDVVVASDGGLLIPALGDGWHPLRTRRFAGGEATNRARADALLRLAAKLTGDERRIGWREGLAVAREGEVLASWEAEGLGGYLANDVGRWTVAENDGFWVPHLWLVPSLEGRRLAELTEEDLASYDDHWARLGRELRRFLGEDLIGRSSRVDQREGG